MEEEQHHWELQQTRNRDMECQSLVEHMRKEGAEGKGGNERLTENLQEQKKGRRKYAPIREELGEVPSTTREEIRPGGGAEHLAVGSSRDMEEESGGELILPPSSSGKGEEVGEVLTPRKLPQFGKIGALTQRRMSEYLTPVRDKAEPRAAILTELPPTRDEVRHGAFEGAATRGGGDEIGGGIADINAGDGRGH